MTRIEENDRWAAAERLAAGEVDERLMHRRGTTLLWIVVLVLVGVVTGMLFALLLPSRPEHTDAAVIQSHVLIGWSISGLGFAVAVVAFVWGRRTGHYIPRWRAVLSPLSREERKSAVRQLRGKEALDTRHATVIVAAARQSQRATWGYVPLVVALTLMAVGSAISSGIFWATWLFAAAVVLFAASGIVSLIRYREVAAFLNAHEGTLGD
ncbi:MFS family permease [Leifsonia sp. 563]|uniref:hypothetical protein n=1 Tax=Leifsonia sp. 563 TaxID=3156412 RepID=UPI0033970897